MQIFMTLASKMWIWELIKKLGLKAEKSSASIFIKGNQENSRTRLFPRATKN